MEFVETLMIGISLSMDAFAIALCKGMKMEEKVNKIYAIKIAIFFGVFQGGMTLAGWKIGNRFEDYALSFGHWIAFFLLVAIGIKTILQALDPENDVCTLRQDMKELLVISFATSIDAFVVGLSFSFLERSLGIYNSAEIIGITTFVLTLVGVVLGYHFGISSKRKAEFIGGIVLILIGINILLSHIL